MTEISDTMKQIVPDHIGIAPATIKPDSDLAALGTRVRLTPEIKPDTENPPDCWRLMNVVRRLSGNGELPARVRLGRNIEAERERS